MRTGCGTVNAFDADGVPVSAVFLPASTFLPKRFTAAPDNSANGYSGESDTFSASHARSSPVSVRFVGTATSVSRARVET